MMGLLSMTTNGYTVDITTNQESEAANVINVTANRTALLDLDTTVSITVITPEGLKIEVLTTRF